MPTPPLSPTAPLDANGFPCHLPPRQLEVPRLLRDGVRPAREDGHSPDYWTGHT